MIDQFFSSVAQIIAFMRTDIQHMVSHGGLLLAILGVYLLLSIVVGILSRMFYPK